MDRCPLPAPTGAHPVGRRSIELVDPERRERYSTDPTDRRELVLWAWYPAAPPAGAEPADYLPPQWAPVAEFLGVAVDGVRSHAVADALPAAGPTRYPVLLLTPSGFSPLLLAALAEELASHGHVVVGVNPTYETMVTAFADGRIVPMNPAALGGALGTQTGSFGEAAAARAAVCDYKTDDLATVADHLERLEATGDWPLAGRLDLGRLGALGHSFGGNASLEWARRDRRCRAAVNLDGALWTEVGRSGLDRPALQILSEHAEFAVSGARAVELGLAPDADWFDAEKSLTFGGWRRVAETAGPERTATIKGSSHMSFMDVPFLAAGDNAAVKAMLATTTIDATRMWRVTSDLLLAFFAEQLDGRPQPPLEEWTADHPEVAFGAP